MVMQMLEEITRTAMLTPSLHESYGSIDSLNIPLLQMSSLAEEVLKIVCRWEVEGVAPILILK